MKKLILVLFLTLITANAFAAAPDLTIGSVNAQPGQTISVPVTVDLSVPITSSSFTIQYDPTLITATNVTLGAGDANWSLFFNPNTAGTIRIGMFNATPISGTQQIATLNFTVIGTKSSVITVSNVNFDAATIPDVTNCNVSISLPGDVNGDGQVTILDASLVAQYSIGLTNFNPAQVSLGDVSGDGTVTIYDAALIAEYATGIINKFH